MKLQYAVQLRRSTGRVECMPDDSEQQLRQVEICELFSLMSVTFPSYFFFFTRIVLMTVMLLTSC
jgi:hypothetical protein